MYISLSVFYFLKLELSEIQECEQGRQPPTHLCCGRPILPKHDAQQEEPGTDSVYYLLVPPSVSLCSCKAIYIKCYILNIILH